MSRTTKADAFSQVHIERKAEALLAEQKERRSLATGHTFEPKGGMPWRCRFCGMERQYHEGEEPKAAPMPTQGTGALKRARQRNLVTRSDARDGKCPICYARIGEPHAREDCNPVAQRRAQQKDKVEQQRVDTILKQANPQEEETTMSTTRKQVRKIRKIEQPITATNGKRPKKVTKVESDEAEAKPGARRLYEDPAAAKIARRVVRDYLTACNLVCHLEAEYGDDPTEEERELLLEAKRRVSRIEDKSLDSALEILYVER